ncbi:hypothetical protein FVE85_6293 [Porphyridium purpureum]|uniref:Uncharacterized protein n=1 Tax=Porphyridium purpureum TaxID=35688 RepID=A0A5J4Z655_PORPP|nr:hypothetical protein FVE85_6293 [Porphyridium purpureum]|eukprot:POR6280..scf295_1
MPSYILQESALWRRIVQKWGTPRGKATVSVGFLGGAWVIYRVCKFATDLGGDELEREMMEKLENSAEARRIARTSQDAMATVLAQARGAPIEAGHREIPVSPILWHPKVMEQDRREREEAARQRTARLAAEQDARPSNAPPPS